MENRLFSISQCMFKEHYRFDLCVNCTGYQHSRFKECKHYLPKFKVIQKATERNLRRSLDETGMF